jgi:hypothetical protein
MSKRRKENYQTHFMKKIRLHTPLGALTAPALAGLLMLQPLISSAATEPPASINIEDFPATVIDDVVVPEPSEVFTVLDKLSEPDWHREIRTQQPPRFSERYRISLLLGTTIADGFVAVQARDPEAVKEVGQHVLRLSEAIAVKNSVLPHTNSILDAAENSDWTRVRDELDKAQQSVKEAMVELKDEQLAQLISLGGWLRGTEVLTALVQRNYTPDTAELLRQPDLLDYFQNKLSEMSPALRGNDLVPRIEKELAGIEPLIDVQDGRRISKESVARIHQVTSQLVQAIEARDAG